MAKKMSARVIYSNGVPEAAHAQKNQTNANRTHDFESHISFWSLSPGEIIMC